MQFGVLCPLLVLNNDTNCVPSAPKQRQLLAFLLMHSNQVVTFADCIDELWSTDLPRSVMPTLLTYVMHVRRELRKAGCPERLLTRGQGYLFQIEPGELDLDRFQTLVTAAREADAAGNEELALDLLTDALALWRGNALTGIAAGPVLRPMLVELEERRRSTVEYRIDLALRLGHHHELLSELATLVAIYPLHENFSAQFMLALYRSGRQSRALQVYRELRNLLAGQYGLEPSRGVQSLHEAILAGSPVLDVLARPPFRLTIDLFAAPAAQSL